MLLAGGFISYFYPPLEKKTLFSLIKSRTENVKAIKIVPLNEEIYSGNLFVYFSSLFIVVLFFVRAFSC